MKMEKQTAARDDEPHFTQEGIAEDQQDDTKF